MKKTKVKAGLIESKEVHGQLVQMYRETGDQHKLEQLLLQRLQQTMHWAS